MKAKKRKRKSLFGRSFHFPKKGLMPHPAFEAPLKNAPRKKHETF